MSSGIADIFQSPEFLDTVGRARTLSDFWPVFASKPLGFTPGSDWGLQQRELPRLGCDRREDASKATDRIRARVELVNRRRSLRVSAREIGLSRQTALDAATESAAGSHLSDGGVRCERRLAAQ
jgi:hypothetical protein